MTEKKRFLQYVQIETREVVHQVDVTGRGEREIARIESGMLRNMRDDLFINDTANDEVDDDYHRPDSSGYSRADEEWFFDMDGKP